MTKVSKEYVLTTVGFYGDRKNQLKEKILNNVFTSFEESKDKRIIGLKKERINGQISGRDVELIQPGDDDPILKFGVQFIDI